MFYNDNILQLIDVYKTGGAEKVYDLFYEWTKDNNINSKKYVFYKSNIKDINYLLEKNHGSFFIKLIDQLTGVKRLKKILRNNKYDYIVSFLDRANILSILAGEKVKNIKQIIVTVHNPPTIQYKKLNKFVRIFVYKLLSYFYNKKNVTVIAVSDAVKESLKSIGIKDVKVVINPLAKKTDETKLMSNVEQQLKNDNYLIAIGRLEYQKAYWKLIKGFYLFKKENKTDLKLLILGEGILKQNMQKLIQKLGLNDSVKCMGYIPEPNVFINNSKGMVFTSIFEGFPITLLENIRAGKPFIGSIPSIPEEIRKELEKYKIDSCFEINNNDENFNSDVFQEDDYIISKKLKNFLSEDYCKEQVSITSTWFERNCSTSNFKRYFIDE